jgi:K+-sensing histidine kinase KdpD
LAAGIAMGAVAVDVGLGGAWWPVLAAAMLVVVTCFVLPAREPDDGFRNGVLAMLRSIRWSPFWIRLCSAVLMVLAVSVLDYLGGFTLGREFNIFLVPIYLAALLLGLPVGLLTWLISLVTVEYCALPPRYSFAIVSLKDFAELITFFYLGLMTIACAHLIRASSTIDEET